MRKRLNWKTIAAGCVLGLLVNAFAVMSLVPIAINAIPNPYEKASDSYNQIDKPEYIIARSLMNSYGGDWVTIRITETPCGADYVNACTTDNIVEINPAVIASELPRTVAHEYAHTLNTFGAVKGSTAEVFRYKTEKPEEILADCTAQYLTDNAYSTDRYAYIHAKCNADQIAVVKELLGYRYMSGEYPFANINAYGPKSSGTRYAGLFSRVGSSSSPSIGTAIIKRGAGS
jgi:hypothetical protein